MTFLNISIYWKLQFNIVTLILIILSTSCNSLLNFGQTSESAGNLSSISDELYSIGFSVYFSRPDSPSSGTLRGGPDMELVKAIEAARVSVDVAVLKFNLWSLRDALIDAHRRGISVRMVIDSDYIDEDEIRELIEAGIPVLGDRREGLMHHKFVIVDRKEVWTGSMNFTISDAYRNNNNLIRIISPDLAENYTTEFDEMFIYDRFGDNSLADTPFPIVYVDGVRIDNCFSPDDRCESRLVNLVDSAQQSINFLIFSFTSDNLANGMLRQSERGVSVSGVFDKSQYFMNRGTEFAKLKAEGLNVQLDENAYSMHHKVIIIDSQVVATGSYNFSYSAENLNDENLLLIYSPEIAMLYQEEYQRIYAPINEK